MTDKPYISDIAPATVAHDGNLRHRIAYAIAQADGDEPGMEPASCDYEMADAVIAELGLRQETEPANRYRGQSTRVVSDWLADE